jgi:methyl-accepting chemotaxis protein
MAEFPYSETLAALDDPSIMNMIVNYVLPVLLLVTIGLMIYFIVSKDIKNTRRNIEEMTNNLNDGKLDSRIDEKEILVDMRPIAASANYIAESLTKPINLMSDYTQTISSGVLPPKYEEDVKGDYNKFKDSLNSLIETLQTFSQDMRSMHHAHNELGDIEVEMATDKYGGVYKEMAMGVNELVASHIDVKKQAISIVSAYGNGDFDATMPELVGKKRFINDALDSVQGNLLGISHEINTLIESAKMGDLNSRGDSSKFSGDWKTIIESLNGLMNEIDRPISESEMILRSLAEGDLTQTMKGDYQGDFDKLKKNINLLVASLTELLGQVKESVETTSETSRQLSENAETIAAGAQEQSSQSEDVASAVEEMSRTITENAMSAQKTAGMAKDNMDIANDGGAVVSQTLSKMRDIAQVVNTSAENIQKLGNSSKEISEIVSVIEDIASQTNLLALNAAIEAARAGEQGRGFAVVADEVRKLAERTTGATQEISNMISGIQSETLSAVDAMNIGNEEVSSGIDLADKAGNALSQIVESSENVLNMINQIAAANEQQSATAEEISKNVIAISDVSSDTARRVEDVARSSESLSKLTFNLEKVVSQFKINQVSADITKPDNKLNGNGNATVNGRGVRNKSLATG